MEKKTIALVIPWYGDSIRGGAEMECNSLAHSLSAAGYPVEVFTTCVKDAACDRGKNTMAPGLYMESGIPVRRFLVREERDVEKYDCANLRIYRNEPFTSEDEEIYFREDINSDEMYAYIAKNKENYRAFIFIPYMYGITYNGSSYCMEKSVLIPCLHDESYAYMQVLKKKMNEFRGIVFNAEPERELAKKLYGLEGVYTELVGVGIDTDWYKAVNPEAFRRKYGIQDEFILYAGRKDAGKKADELIRFFLQYKRDTKYDQLKLVLIGGGELPVLVPEIYRSEVIDLGFVSAEDKHNAFAACTVFCNPSYFESFSIVIMEAWLAKRAVLVSAHCAVTTDFVRKANAGLWYADYREFRECLQYLFDHREVIRLMGENGCRYVLNHFEHGKVAEKYVNILRKCGL